MAPIDWSNNAERREFEHDLEVHRATRRNYSHLQWLGWFSGIVQRRARVYIYLVPLYMDRRVLLRIPTRVPKQATNQN